MRLNRVILFLLLSALGARAQSPRADRLLNDHWRTSTDSSARVWKTVSVPHNWDDYDGYRRLRHGNRHGTAWYSRAFTVPASPRPMSARITPHRRYFLFFEGVGSYATVWLNGHYAGYHAGGRTTFTLDVTDYIHADGRSNRLMVRASHPAGIQDLPWVCGGCSDERGFSEGSQPMGIFRPVHLIITNDIRIEPFGVHVWNDKGVHGANGGAAVLKVETECKNYGPAPAGITVKNMLLDAGGRYLGMTSSTTTVVQPGATLIEKRSMPVVYQAHLWSPADPYLYTLVTELYQNNRLLDRVTTPYGIRTIHWPDSGKGGPFLINGRPFFINGIAEYEHLLGGSHAFTDEQVRSRVQMVKAAGFNAFRDAHQPHNLRYQAALDREGLLWWPQLSTHIWYDTPAFRENFLRLLRDWVKERRNSPSLILWGLQNESKLPADFAAQCTEVIQEMDPTASSMRKVTTCNGGEGTDWNVPQNWTGTYGGNPATYATDLLKQELVGEYGGWRTLGLHANEAPVQTTLRSEDQLAQLMETKIRLADSVKDSVAGHFSWLLTSHDNPGRVQGGEGWRETDRIGPVNYKGLFTPWEEPTDVFYLFRSNFVPAASDPMVYIVSHTNPGRWTASVAQDSIIVYSNCDEVELFNDVDSLSLGKRTRGGVGTHFQWNDVPVRYNVLYAKGYVNGRVAACDTIVLHHLPEAPHFPQLYSGAPGPRRDHYHYIYRVNCGGPGYTDANGDLWEADRPLSASGTWGSSSWTHRFPGLPPMLASQQRTAGVISGTRDWPLYQSFRYGRQELQYSFPLPAGDYRVELYFIEPWINWKGGEGGRVFDVAVNGRTVLHNLDIYKEAGHNRLLKKVAPVHITGGQLIISFPRVAAGQAVISAIAIAERASARTRPAPPSPALLQLPGSGRRLHVLDWMDTEVPCYLYGPFRFSRLPPALYGATWIQPPPAPKPAEKRPLAVTLSVPARIWIAIDSGKAPPAWMQGFTDTKAGLAITAEGGGYTESYSLWSKDFTAGTWVAGDDTNGIGRCFIAAVPATNMEPAYDLKPSVNYKAVKAAVSAGIITDSVNGKPCRVFAGAGPDTLQWHIQTGVADVYSLTVRYYNPGERVFTARLQLLDESDHLLQEETVQLPPSLRGKWSYLNSSTGTMINAGGYRLRLLSAAAGGLALEGLDVQ